MVNASLAVIDLQDQYFSVKESKKLVKFKCAVPFIQNGVMNLWFYVDDF